MERQLAIFTGVWLVETRYISHQSKHIHRDYQISTASLYYPAQYCVRCHIATTTNYYTDTTRHAEAVTSVLRYLLAYRPNFTFFQLATIT